MALAAEGPPGRAEYRGQVHRAACPDFRSTSTRCGASAFNAGLPSCRTLMRAASAWRAGSRSAVRSKSSTETVPRNSAVAATYGRQSRA